MITQDLKTQNLSIEEKEEMEEIIVHNMISEFMNISDEDNRIFRLLKDEFNDLKILNYGSIFYMQTENNVETIPNISELLHIYEEIFSSLTCKDALIINNEKCKFFFIFIVYILYNDGFILIANYGKGKKIYIYKIKTLIVILYSNNPTKIGFYNTRILKILKNIKYI